MQYHKSTFCNDNIISVKNKRPNKAPNKTLPLDTIIKGNCIDLADRLPDSCIDIIFADPPYNLQLQNQLHRPNGTKVNAVDDSWDSFASFEEYDDFTQQWLKAMRRILKPDGTMWIIGSYHNIFRVGCKLQDMGFWLLNDIIWVKSNPMPNFRGRRFTNAHETLIWCSKSKDSKYKFNYAAMKALNDDLQMRSDWKLPICSGGERLKDPDGQKTHPTQKPESLLNRILLASTDPGDVVLDPFSGSGTTAVSACKLSRHFIGFEADAGYVKASRARLKTVKPLSDLELLVTSSNKSKEPRIPFGTLVESGLVAPGTELVSTCKKQHRAKVTVDGTLVSGIERGSIHQIGAKLQGLPSCNGWHYWQLPDRIPIDDLRKKLQAGLTAKH